MVMSLLVASLILILVSIAEWIHQRRIVKSSRLFFGPRQRPSLIAMFAPFAKVLSVSAFAWGMSYLLLASPRVHTNEPLPKEKRQNMLVVLDVSPSMRLVDGGKKRDLTRMQRAAQVMQSIFDRTNPEGYNISVVACYTKAMPVVEQAMDIEVSQHILNDLPMHWAFHPGKTHLATGVDYAVDMAKNWPLESSTMLIISDGDSMPLASLPRLPPSIKDVVCLGVGDARRGLPIDGGMSRQDSSTLRSLATRLHGEYYDVNSEHLKNDSLDRLAIVAGNLRKKKADLREVAMITITASSALWMLLPILLHYFGTSWQPGIPTNRISTETTTKSSLSQVTMGV